MTTRWTLEQARKELDAWRSSGQSIEAFAKERHVAPYRLRYWQKRLTDRPVASKTKPLSLLPVRVAHAGAPIELVLPSGCIARVGRGFDEDTLVRLVALFGRV
jgi:hypothetical protein